MEGKGLVKVALAQATVGMLVRLEWNVITIVTPTGYTDHGGKVYP